MNKTKYYEYRCHGYNTLMVRKPRIIFGIQFGYIYKKIKTEPVTANVALEDIRAGNLTWDGFTKVEIKDEQN